MNNLRKLIVLFFVTCFFPLFAEASDFCIGATCGIQHRYPMLEFEFIDNNWDFQIDLFGFACPAEVYDNGELIFSGVLGLFQGALNIGHLWHPFENQNHSFGLGLTYYGSYSGYFNRYNDESAWHSLRLYYKYSYTFNSRFEVGFRNYIALGGCRLEKTEDSKNTWQKDWYFSYFGTGAFWELGTIFPLFIPAVEVKYHFK